MKEYPFAHAKFFSYEEARFLKRYILAKESPGAREIVGAFEEMDRAIRRLQRTIEKSRIGELHKEYVPDRMTLRYISAMADIIGMRLDIVSDSILGDFITYDHSDEAIRPLLEPPALAIWRKARRKSAALEAKQAALEEEVRAKLARRGSRARRARPD